MNLLAIYFKNAFADGDTWKEIMKEGFVVSEKREGRKENFPRKKRIGDKEKYRKEKKIFPFF